MTPARRSLLRHFGAATLGLAAPLLVGNVAFAQAQAPNWPNKPIRVVVALAPGGLADVLARSVQNPLATAFGQPVIVDNRPGAGGNIAGSEVAHNGDDHTFLVVPTTTESVNPLIYSGMNFAFGKDLQPVGLLANSQLFLLTKADLPPNTLPEFLEYLKANPNKMSFGSAGNGTTPHLAGALLNQRTGATSTHVPYRGAAPAIQDLMAGQIDYAFGPISFMPMVQSGKLKLLGVASRDRSPRYGDIPTFTEAGVPQVYADSMFGIYAPASMPPAMVQRFNAELNRVLAQPEIAAKFAELGAEALPLSPADFQARVKAEAEIFTPVIKALNLKVE